MENANDSMEIIQASGEFNTGTPQSHLSDNPDTARRRSSNRSIKRKKFDDELVEYSLGVPGGVSNVKSGRARSQSSHSEVSVGGPSTPPIATPQPLPVPQLDFKKKQQTSKTMSGSSSRKPKKSGKPSTHLVMKDLGRWKPIDDLALIIGVQQTNDLRQVYLGTKFSCKFTMGELQHRWYALLYDSSISRVAVSAIRNLHPDMIATVQDRALWSKQEEDILSTIKSNTNPPPKVETFAELLSQHPNVFYTGRTASALYRHWQTLRMYHLLPDQIVTQPPTHPRPVMCFNDAEDLIDDSELNDPPDELLDRELRLQQRKNVKEIRQLENELGRCNVLVDSVTDIRLKDMDAHVLAILRGRLVRYLMRSREISIGRSSKGFTVDIDLSLEGPAQKISRRQGTLRLKNTGEFYLSSEGKRPIFVDGRPIAAGNKVRLFDNAVVEIGCLRFIFSINHDLIRAIHNESIRYSMS